MSLRQSLTGSVFSAGSLFAAADQHGRMNRGLPVFDAETGTGTGAVETPGDEELVELSDRPRDPTEYEKKLRRELRQARSANRTAEAASATALAASRTENEAAPVQHGSTHLDRERTGRAGADHADRLG